MIGDWRELLVGETTIGVDAEGLRGRSEKIADGKKGVRASARIEAVGNHRPTG